MNSKIEKFFNDNSNEDKVKDYSIGLESFVRDNDLNISGHDGFEEKMKEIFSRRFFKNKYANNESIDKLENPNYLNNYFRERGYRTLDSRNLINEGGTTLFVSSGVQYLEDVVFNEAEIPNDDMYISQPVLRTQFIDQVKEGVNTSFLNISAISVNKNIDEHFKTLKDCLGLLDNLGLDKSNIDISLREDSPRWGNKNFKNKVLTIFYNGLEIGDAVYNYDIPQESRDNLAISDVGFGMERIRYALDGSSYFRDEEKGYSARILDYTKTLAILAGSGLKPSNIDQGYRFRQFSKHLMDINTKEHTDISSLIKYYYKFWNKWNKLPVGLEKAEDSILIENERNFNRILINRLLNSYPNIHLDINQKTSSLVKKLESAKIDKKYLDNILNEMYGK